MSQATFDSTTSGGPADDAGGAETRETRAARGQNPRRRPSRRGHATKATAETTAQPTTPASAEQEPAPAPANAANAANAAPATTTAPTSPAPAAEETSAHPEGRGRRSRGGAKRPAARGKAGAQLIMPKTNEEEQQAQPEAATEGAPTPVAALRATAEQAAPLAIGQSAVEAAPVVVPVVSAGAEEAAPATPRKTRFGLPRRLRQPEATPAAPTPLVSAAATQPDAPTAETPAASETPAVETPATTETLNAEPAPRYRFDRSRRTTLPGVTYARPERLSSQSQRPSLYTSAAEPATTPTTTPEPGATPEPATEPSAEARQQLFDLPPLESLVGGAAELPTLAFDEPAARSTATPEPAEEAAPDEAEQTGEEADGEGGAASSRRRRRRRRNTSGHNGAHSAEADETTEDFGAPTAPDETLESLYGEEPFAATEPSEPDYQEPQQSARAPYAEPGAQRRSGRFGYSSRTTRRAPTEPGWETPQQQTETSPYSGPEPSYSRGFGPTPSGVASPLRESYPRPSRVERGADVTAGTVAQLGATIREAINTQTDRLLTELRHQQPPAVTLSIPNAQTAERVGVFVDVANVVYSARGLRTSVDFGRLLDFLRANRRLARAQAYAPTNPEQGADQAFLNAVKGLGYRITTKNYKTFSNGAKKADLDLDLCMDIVRLVESRAVDTIVLVSGDSDFLPLLDYCTDHGVRVEVAAFDDAASMILRQSCDLFVNLSLVDGIRG